MKTIFHDKESGTKLEMEGTFANSKAQVIDDEGDVTTEFEGSYSEIMEMISQLSYELTQEKEEPKQYEEPLTNSDFHGAKVKVLEDIEDEHGDIVKEGTATRDITVLAGENLYVKHVIVEPKDFKKLEILTDEQEDIQEGELFVVNNDEMDYYLGFDKGEIVKFLFHKEEGLPLEFKNSQGIEQGVKLEDVTKLGDQEANSKKFDFCAKNNILFTEDTSLKGTKVNLTKQSAWIEDDGSLIINTDCDDGIPYIKSTKSGYGAFISLENLEIRNEDTPSFEIGETVEVKKGRAHSGAVGYAILVDIKEDEIILQGFNKHGEFLDSWHNNIENIKKVK